MKLVEEISSRNQAKTVSELVLAAQAGDREAFGELFERYRPVIVALAMRRVRNADEAMDWCNRACVRHFWTCYL